MKKFWTGLTLLTLLIIRQVSGQELHVPKEINCIDSRHNYLYTINLETRICIRYDGKSDAKKIPVDFISIKMDDIPPVISNNYFEIAPNRFLITITGTGQMYIFNVLAGTFERIDKTFYRGNNFGAVQFVRKDTLISIGGKGFWRIHNIPTYFNTKSKEWDYYKPISEKGPVGISSEFGGYNPKIDQLFTIGFPQLYSENSNLAYPFYQFNLANATWKELGIVEFDNPNLKNFKNGISNWIAPFFFSSNLAMGEFIDPIENKIYQYKGNYSSLFLLATHVYIKNERLYSFQRSYNQNKFEVKLDSIDLKTLKKSSIIIGQFYLPNAWYNRIKTADPVYYVFLFIIFILVGIIIFISQNKAKQSKSTWSQLPQEGAEFLKFIQKKENLICTTDELNTILGCSDKSIESQRQYRSKFITSVNLFFERNFEIKEAITRNQSDTDKRYVDYQLNSDAVEIAKNKFPSDT